MKNTDPTVENWDREWKIYSRKPFFKPNLKVITVICQTFSNKLKGEKILELGAGSGCDIVSLAKKGAEAYAIDFSLQSIKTINYWSKRMRVKITAKRADIKKIPFPNNYFNMVYSVGLMEHFKNYLSLIKEQIRVIKPGGFLLVDVPQKFTLYTVAKHLRMKLGSHPFGWEIEYSKNELIQLAKKLNQEVYQIYGRESDIISRFPAFIRPIGYRFFSKHIENSFLSPYVSLCIGIILKVKK